MTRENDLLNRIKDGDSEALNNLVMYYYPDILRYCLWHAPNRESAEDAAQETFLKAIRYMDNYVHKGRFKAFLYKIAANTCVDMHRKRCLNDLSLENQQEEFPYTEQGFLEIESDIQIRQMTSRLPGQLREVVLLRYGQNLTLREIAIIMEIPLRTVQSRLRSALKKLGAELMDYRYTSRNGGEEGGKKR